MTKALLLVDTEDWLDENGKPVGAVVKITDHGCGISEDNIPADLQSFLYH